jgi:hypothetical protein
VLQGRLGQQGRRGLWGLGGWDVDDGVVELPGRVCGDDGLCAGRYCELPGFELRFVDGGESREYTRVESGAVGSAGGGRGGDDRGYRGYGSYWTGWVDGTARGCGTDRAYGDCGGCGCDGVARAGISGGLFRGDELCAGGCGAVARGQLCVSGSEQPWEYAFAEPFAVGSVDGAGPDWSDWSAGAAGDCGSAGIAGVGGSERAARRPRVAGDRRVGRGARADGACGGTGVVWADGAAGCGGAGGG